MPCFGPIQQLFNFISVRFHWIQLVCSPWDNKYLKIFAVFLNVFNIKKLGGGVG